MQNCLKCEGSAYCTVCAFPTSTSVNSNTAGCNLPYVPTIQCEVTACQECIQPNVCSVCAQGYSLTAPNTCTHNTCDNYANCELCSETQLVCYLCEYGYIQDIPLYGLCELVSLRSDKNCGNVVLHCSYCQN